MIDRRDPQALGKTLLATARLVRAAAGGAPIPLSKIYDDHLVDVAIPDFKAETDVLERYGRPDELEPRFMEIQVA